ncbi:hypothetical protein Tco_0238385 [Tanacetum coccineum]
MCYGVCLDNQHDPHLQMLLVQRKNPSDTKDPDVRTKWGSTEPLEKSLDIRNEDTIHTSARGACFNPLKSFLRLVFVLVEEMRPVDTAVQVATALGIGAIHSGACMFKLAGDSASSNIGENNNSQSHFIEDSVLNVCSEAIASAIKINRMVSIIRLGTSIVNSGKLSLWDAYPMINTNISLWL